jgi:hypothetical protein
LEQYKKQQFPRLSLTDGKKRKRPATLFHALQRLAQVNRENDYLIAKWYNREMEDVRFMVLRDYLSAIEQILKENDKQQKQAGMPPKK